MAKKSPKSPTPVLATKHKDTRRIEQSNQKVLEGVGSFA
jgi:hypothetical protein